MDRKLKIGIAILVVVAAVMISGYSEAKYHKGDIITWSGDDWVGVNESEGRILGTVQTVYHGTGMYEIKLHPYYMYDMAKSTSQYQIDFIDCNTELIT